MKTPSTTPPRTNGGTADDEENVARTVAGLLRLRWWCAPMVEQSDCAFRKLCRALKCGVASTPMIQARSFVQSERYRAQWILHGDPMVCATTWPSDSIAQTIPGIREGVPDLHFTLSTADAPLIVQFAGNDPDRDRPGGQMRGGGAEFRMLAELCLQRSLWRVLNE